MRSTFWFGICFLFVNPVMETFVLQLSLTCPILPMFVQGSFENLETVRNSGVNVRLHDADRHRLCIVPSSQELNFLLTPLTLSLHVVVVRVQCPLLCKEFVIDVWQIYYARSKGADAVLLIAAVLPDLDIKYMLRVCMSLGMTALVEVSDHKLLALGYPCKLTFFFFLLRLLYVIFTGPLSCHGKFYHTAIPKAV